MRKVPIYILVIITACLSATGQVSFDSIKICHDASNALKQVTVKEYVVNIQNGQLSSFHSLDGVVSYNDYDRKLTLRGINRDDSKMDSVSIQLTSTGEVICVNRGKAITLQEIKSAATDTSIGIDLPSVSFLVKYSKGFPRKMWVSVVDKRVEFLLKPSSKGYSWNVYIATNTDKNALLLSQSGGRNWFLNLFDDSNKVGLRLWSDKENGTFNRIQGVRYFEEYSDFGVDGYHTLFYSQKGILKKNKWKEPLRCD